MCLSGIHPNEADALRDVYGKYVEWVDDEYEELAACVTAGSFDSYGFDVRTWCKLVGRIKEKRHVRTCCSIKYEIVFGN